MTRHTWSVALLLAACATPEREARPAGASGGAPASALPGAALSTPTPRAPAAAVCDSNTTRLEVRRKGDEALLEEDARFGPSERVYYWGAELAANVHAIAVSDRAPKDCAIVGECQALVLVDCGDGYTKLLGGRSPTIRPEPNEARFAAGQWLDLVSLEPSQEVPHLLVRTRWQFTDGPERPRREVDCPTVDASASRLSEASSTPMKGLDLQVGKRLPPVLLPGETFRIPLGPLATYNPLRAIGYVKPGRSSGIGFAMGECVLEEWFYAFGGVGVELTLEPAPIVRLPDFGRALLLVKAQGINRRKLEDDANVPPTSHARELVFAVDERRVTIVADTENEAVPVSYSRLEQHQNQVWLLVTSANGKAQRKLYDARAGEFVDQRARLSVRQPAGSLALDAAPASPAHANDPTR